MMKYLTFRANNTFLLGVLVILALGGISINAGQPGVEAISNPRSLLPNVAGESDSQRIFLPTVMRNAASFCSDDFNQTRLQPCWSWVHEDPSWWSLTESPGYLQILSDSSAIGSRNLLLQNPPAGEYDIRTRLVFTPTHNFQLAGMVFYANENDYLAFGRAFCDSDPPTCVGNGVYFDLIEDGQFLLHGISFVFTRVLHVL